MTTEPTVTATDSRLSKLQKAILVLALQGHEHPEEGGQVDVYYDEVLAAFYGWPYRKDGRVNTRIHWIGQNFSPEEIGHKRYAVGHAALSRAMIRLHRRDLIVRMVGTYKRFSAAVLTFDGIDVAKRLREDAKCHTLNRIKLPRLAEVVK